MASASEPLSSANSYDISRTFPRRRRHIVGLLNQGGTCYLNSLLQTLFHTPEFTYRLFNLTSTNKSALKSIIRELLRLFYGLMTLRKFAISSKSLTDSFGWTDDQVFVHQDVQELNRLLFEEIETSLKGTVEANLINDLYRGMITTKIKCLKCGYCSVREDAYLDVNLAVLEHDSVEDCLKAQINVERLDGDNQYFCDKCKGKVDAVKATYFKEYPPILTLCLARFDYDPRTMQSIKVDKNCSFPLILDVSEFMETKQPHKIVYDLFSIVIHVGNSTLGGHYHAYIKDPYGFEIESEENENNILGQLRPSSSGGEKRDFSQVCGPDSTVGFSPDDQATGSVMTGDQTPHPVSGAPRSYSGLDPDDSCTLLPGPTTRTTEGVSVMNSIVSMTGDEAAPRPDMNEADSQSSNPYSKKSASKFGALFDLIRNFWTSSSSPNPIQDLASNSCSLPDREASQLVAHDPICAKVEENMVSAATTTDYSYEERIQEEALELSSSSSSQQFYDTNNNETLDGWRSKIFDTNFKRDVVHGPNEPESEDSNVTAESKSSKSKPTSNTSRSFIATPVKMKFQSDSTGNSHLHERKSDSKIELKLTKSDSIDRTKTKSKFIESGRWFDFNDESITEIKTKDFQKVFQGQECAYILFYRSRGLLSNN